MSDTLSAPSFPITAGHALPRTAHTRNGEIPAAVLDSNAVLDWLLFGDPSMQRLGQAIRAGHCRWIVTSALRDELEHVLARGLRSRPQADAGPLWETWQQLTCLVEPPADAPPPPGLRCTDGDDQKFLAVALAHSARWLVSRDRALLKLRRRARERGLLILTPAQWSLETTAAPG
ncbi:putative toxin-antitoxin system toxin component, PIN family [uncultured Azohydromonas sp.]|jgi:Predicted nucleic acid-binding protein, contains PIN domain|uniref:PIN domain-containing protein n=1 Tax=uncultured Azohydromonas sp. TaxID=487342 RepID=UPI00261D0DE6|nr:PIN domain-containing protein [uncultured Azohydromonas sp.]